MRIVPSYLRFIGLVGLVLVTGWTTGSSLPEAYAIEALQGLSPAKQKLADDFASAVTGLLPQPVIQAIGPNVYLRFAKLDSYSEIIPPACPGEVPQEKPAASVLGKTQARFTPGAKRTIVLNRNFLKEISGGPAQARKYSCGHRDLYRLAIATAVHEISHLYLKAKGSAFKKNYRNFLAWKRGLLDTRSKNQFYGRSPDPYEFRNLTEHFAVNAEYFLLDPEYRCRRPEQYRYFGKHFGYSAHSVTPVCKLNTEVRLATSLQPMSLDPTRVYEIHYLLADQGSAFESKWGHAMYRIIQCAPSRPQVGPECVQDIGSHLVVSFRASISGLNASKLGGLSGKFPSQLFLYSVPEIVGEYTMSESRPVKSVPLKLSPTQVEQFVGRTLELYWEYQGRYYFFGNNCATESLHFLGGVLAEGDNEAKVPGAWLATPTGMYKKFRKAGLLNESVFSDPEANGRYFFPSFKTRAEEAFRRISSRRGFDPALSMDRFLREYGAADRRELYLRLKAADSQEIASIAIRFYTLELLIRERQNAVLKIQASQAVDEAQRYSQEQPEAETVNIAQMIAKLAKLRSELQPWFFAHQGYGVPQQRDYRDLSEFKVKVDTIRELANGIMGELKSSRSNVFEEFESISANTMFFMMEIRNTKKGS
ncbi:MAG TPA: hypothetical protein DCS07_18220 [Bdellovibrionales bacterium]|nr:MAG: hypothetical protein A2Z97_01865 [Bdellovibrionales bacterium GWB1_52_6]OFZ04908.1 MAG: hypothetical protein A2X97_16210 [Bdellovibrionales bacterium GWA1_52_35]OFZ40429.1 MAG: hypothetical protein A2070_02180 [Bdellovibrionales bacterium GWC1_52_8]HAR44539.1 hypothetical protein [Bdellovibrionales bacterium]HCM38841.1 hypothetical protein [Bdellovibrionales bacterium]